MAIKTIGKSNMNTEVIKSEKPVLLDFWAPWCVYCKRLSPVLDRLAEKLEGSLDIGKVNIDEESEIEQEYGIDVIPTVLLFKNGEHGEKLVAPQSQAQLEVWLKEQGV